MSFKLAARWLSITIPTHRCSVCCVQFWSELLLCGTGHPTKKALKGHVTQTILIFIVTTADVPCHHHNNQDDDDDNDEDDDDDDDEDDDDDDDDHDHNDDHDHVDDDFDVGWRRRRRRRLWS